MKQTNMKTKLGRHRSFFYFLALIFFWGPSCVSSKKWSAEWGGFQEPSKTESEAIGYYSAGCMAGGRSLNLNSDNYLIMNRHRNRFYGHPSLIAYVEELSAQVKHEGYGLSLIGDLAQPRGGPMLTGHASHQVGLDVDVWFRRMTPKEAKGITVDKLKSLKLVYLAKDNEMTKDWNDSYAQVLRLAADRENVERIFINPRIKKELCVDYRGQAWMRKLRPWWGHDEHFHVRLSCPEDSKHCRKQSPPPQGDGCDDDLEWWFSQEAQEELAKRSQGSKTEPVLPKECKPVANIE